MNILTIAPALMSGAAFLAGFYHLLIYSRQKHQRFNLTFALLCFSVGVYDFFTTGLYLSASVAEGMWWSRAQIITLQLCAVALLWFIMDYIQHKPRKILYAFTIYWYISALLSALNPFNILQDPTRPSIKHFDFGWVEITYNEVESGVLSSIQGLSTILLFSYIIFVILKYYRRGYRKEAKPLLIVFTLFFIGIFNDSAVVVYLYENIYLIEYTYIFMVTFMTYIISKKVVNAAVLEQALHESDARYRHIVEGMTDGLALVDRMGRLYFVNEHLCKLMGYQSNELLGHYLREFLDAENLKILDNERSQQRKGKRGTFEVAWNGIGRNKVHTLVSAAFLFDKDRNFTGSIAVVTDITERKRAEETLKKLYEETLKISEMKSNLISFVSHELKTPIVPILGWAQLMQKALDQGLDLNKVMEKEGVEGIIRSSNRLSTIISNFLDLDRLERGGIHLEKQPWPVITLLDNAIKEVKDFAQTKVITIKNSCENLTLNVDGFRIERVFINILTNAIKYSESNTSIEIYSEKEDSKFMIYFRDQGYGFTPEELRDIWQPFTTAYLRKKNTSSTGTGIGLRLSKGIIEEHNGHIEISSPGLDQGSTVKITFPLEDGQ